MHILISSVYHFSTLYGGNEHYAHHLATQLVDLGHHVSYVCAYQKSKSNTKYAYQLIHQPTLELMQKALPSASWFKVLKYPKFDVVHACGSGLPLSTLSYAYKRLHTPTVLTFQAPLNPKNVVFSLGAAIENASISACYNAVITTSPSNATVLSNQYSHLPVHCIPLFLSPTFTKLTLGKIQSLKRLKPKYTRTVLFVGQLDSHHYYKGVNVLLKALKILPEQYRLVIIGDGDQKKDYQFKAHDIGVGKRTEFLGAINHSQIPDHMARADVLVLPSINSSEGFGMVLLEAMACNTPTITTSVVGSANYFQKHKVATIIPPLDSKRLAKAIQQSCEINNSSRITNAYRFALKHTLRNMALSTIKVYSSLIH